MKKRNLWKVLLYSVITFGLYNIYWFIVTAEELRKKTHHHIPPIIYALIPSFIASVGIIMIMAMEEPNITAMYALVFISLSFTLWWYWKYSVAASKVIGGGFTPGFIFILFIFFDDFMPLFLQWKYNKTLDAKK